MDTQLDASLITGLSPSFAVDNSNNYHTFSDMDTMEVNYFSTECDNVKIVFDIRQQYLHNYWFIMFNVYTLCRSHITSFCSDFGKYSSIKQCNIRIVALDFWRNYAENVWLIVIIVSADDLASLGAGTVADTLMTKFGSHKYIL